MELDPSQFYPIKPIGLSKKIPDQPDELEIRKGHRAYLIMVVQYPSWKIYKNYELFVTWDDYPIYEMEKLSTSLKPTSYTYTIDSS